jgi:glycine cleavage system H protein
VTPDKLLFAKSHEWIAVDKAAGTATVGISAFALQALTDLVYIELPKVGRQVKAGESFGEIESVKAVSDIYAPLSGEIVEVHSTLSDKLETLNSDPYGEGWLVKIKMTSEAELKSLMDYPAYQKQCAEESH